MILDNKLGAGDRLPTELELSQRFSVSRNAIREALRVLQAQGVLEIRHGHGIYVREMTLAGLADTLAFWAEFSERAGNSGLRPFVQARDVLETNLVRLVAPLLREGDLRELSSAVLEMEERAESGRYALEADRKFHDVLYRPLANWFLTGLLEAFWLVLTKAESEGKVEQLPPQRVAQQHRAILEALKKADPEAAAAAMSAHFDNMLERLSLSSRPPDLALRRAHVTPDADGH